MSLSKKIRKLWHDLYYASSGDQGVWLALTCEEATRLTNTSGRSGLRYWLHLSVCQACKNYAEFSNLVRTYFKSKPVADIAADQLDKFNEKLKNTYCK